MPKIRYKFNYEAVRGDANIDIGRALRSAAANTINSPSGRELLAEASMRAVDSQEARVWRGIRKNMLPSAATARAVGATAAVGVLGAVTSGGIAASGGAAAPFLIPALVGGSAFLLRTAVLGADKWISKSDSPLKTFKERQRKAQEQCSAIHKNVDALNGASRAVSEAANDGRNIAPILGEIREGQVVTLAGIGRMLHHKAKAFDAAESVLSDLSNEWHCRVSVGIWSAQHAY